MIKACSFLPAATAMIQAMGLEAHLHGVTFECPADRPRVVRSILEGKAYSSVEIERVVSEASQKGESLYYIEMELLEAIAPDVIFTQHVCDVCQIGTSYVERAIYQLDPQPQVVPLVPRRLADVFENAQTIASSLGHPERGHALIAALEGRLARVTDQLRAAFAVPRRVMVMEWLDPIYNCGHWIPDQIALAGGVDMLSNPGGYSIVTPWEKVIQYNPEVLVLAPCGFHVSRARAELDRITERPGFREMVAVQRGEVYLADADLFTRPSTTLVDGIELLAALFHPHLFTIPAALVDKVMPVLTVGVE
jgi:iron complex transport system substrate-binding protein